MLFIVRENHVFGGLSVVDIYTIVVVNAYLVSSRTLFLLPTYH